MWQGAFAHEFPLYVNEVRLVFGWCGKDIWFVKMHLGEWCAVLSKTVEVVKLLDRSYHTKLETVKRFRLLHLLHQTVETSKTSKLSNCWTVRLLHLSDQPAKIVNTVRSVRLLHLFHQSVFITVWQLWQLKWQAQQSNSLTVFLATSAVFSIVVVGCISLCECECMLVNN